MIRAHNEERHVGRLLSGLLHQTVSSVEIILVDSGSTDATVSIASQYPVRILSIQPDEFSFGRALNIGCREATGQFVVAASAHVYPVYEDWIERLIAPFGERNVALTYGKQRGDHRTRFSEQRVFERWFPDHPGGHQKHPFCNNANAAIRRCLWEGYPYNEDLTGLEDIDWAQRVTEKGHSVVYVPEAEVVHVHEELPRQIFNRYRREAIAMKQVFPHERFGIFDFVRLWTSNVLSDAVFAAQHGAFWRQIGSIGLFRTMQFWGTYRGYTLHEPVNSALRQTFYYPNSWRDTRSLPPRSAKQIEYGSLEHVEN